MSHTQFPFNIIIFFIHYVALIHIVFLRDLSKLYLIKLVLYQIHNLKGCCMLLMFKIQTQGNPGCFRSLIIIIAYSILDSGE